MPAGSTDGRALAKRRQLRRLTRLKKRTALASVLGFAALFGLVAQHVVKCATSSGTPHVFGTPAAASTSRFFDSKPSGFAFGQGSESTSSVPATTTAQSAPVAQSSVS